MVPTSARNREEIRTDANSNFINAGDAESQKAAEEKKQDTDFTDLKNDPSIREIRVPCSPFTANCSQMVPAARVELGPHCWDMNLNHARLPIH